MKTKNKRNYQKQSGITLIALVITIAVLLILAAVSISALFGDSGIIDRAKEAQSETNKAIVYIQAMGNANYANQTDGNGTLKNTGSTGDEKCKIFDMAGNTVEWTTEYSTCTVGSVAYPCTNRGGYCINSGKYTSLRSNDYATFSVNGISFRPLLYVK
mgnify:CR=1 FL=1